MELVTPIFEDLDELYDFLYSLHVFSAKNLKDEEMLWPFSMPPIIKDESAINLGYYHQSNIGLLKHVYRRGLKTRYGPTMQCVSGMHYNFSLKKESLQKLINDTDQCAIDDAYLGLIRNFKDEILERNKYDPLIQRKKEVPYLVDQHLLEKENA